MHDALPGELQFSTVEREVLSRAAHLADREAPLREVVARDGARRAAVFSIWRPLPRSALLIFAAATMMICAISHS